MNQKETLAMVLLFRLTDVAPRVIGVKDFIEIDIMQNGELTVLPVMSVRLEPSSSLYTVNVARSDA